MQNRWYSRRFLFENNHSSIVTHKTHFILHHIFIAVYPIQNRDNARFKEDRKIDGESNATHGIE